MASYPSFVDIDFNKQSILNAKIYPLSTAARTALSLVAGDAGLAVFDTSLNKLLVWTGSTWGDATPAITGGLIFRGGIAASATAPASPEVGDLYVFTSAGTLGGSWTPSAVVAIGDQALWDGSAWQYIQGNSVSTSTTVEGLIQLATQAEVDAGSVTNKAVTPATFTNFTPPAALTLRPVRRFKTLVASLTANTAATVTHNLALGAAAECVVNVFQGSKQILLAIAPVDENSLTVTSNVALSNVTVVVEG